MTGNSRTITWRLLGGSMLVLGLLGLVGCGSKGTLSGKVTYKQQPLPKGTIIVFLHAKSDRSVQAEIKTDDGSYKVEGLPLGDYKIGVQPYTPPTIGGAGPVMGNPMSKKDKTSVMGPGESKDVIQPPPGVFDFGKESQSTFFIPDQYKDPARSGLTVTVKGGKQDHPITIPD